MTSHPKRTSTSARVRATLLSVMMASTVGGACLTDADRSSTEQEVQAWRNDQNGIATPGSGPFGGRMGRTYCNDNSFAIGFRMRVEGSQGGGDDTALNSVQLLCKDVYTSAQEWISSYDGIWGTWRSASVCPWNGNGNYLTGARLRIEPPQGGGDDTGANDAWFQCRSSGTLTSVGGMGFGSWGGWSSCPANTAVCGIEIFFEPSQGGGDDTAMNGMELHCCNLPCSNSCNFNGQCDSVCENPQSCQSDCGYCGDRICGNNEDSSWCSDCSVCNDGMCTAGEDAWSCNNDCGFCTDGICSISESSGGGCPQDCGFCQPGVACSE